MRPAPPRFFRRLPPLAALPFALLAFAPACGGARSPDAGALSENAAERRAIEATLDAWHEAASRADESAYFAHFEPYAVFLGTDATERWTVAELRAYARPRFARGQGWTMRAKRRGITLVRDAGIAWFDEELETAKLGPARGTGVLVRSEEGAWKIAQYSLSLTVPNERFEAVRAALEGSGGAEATEGADGANEAAESAP